MPLTIHDAHLQFNGTQKKRSSTSVIVVHHSGVSVRQTVGQIHDYYLKRKDPNGDTYIGICYHYVVMKDGTVWKGREEWAVGGHAGPVANPVSIGICFEGNFETETMGKPQLEAGIALTRDILSRYPGLAIKKHRDYMNTACPGGNFPLENLKTGAGQTAPADASAGGTFPGAQYFGPGRQNDSILRLDRTLIAHGYARFYKLGRFGASRKWGKGTEDACRAFQRSQGWEGSGADGIPGPETWKRLGL